MSGIVFLRTNQLDKIIDFYQSQIGMTHWVSQPDIEILQHGNLLVGFHKQAVVDKDVLLTFFYDTKEEVNKMYQKLEDIATDEPKVNEKYQIYNFFANDPDGRKIEFQTFLHELPPF